VEGLLSPFSFRFCFPCFAVRFGFGGRVYGLLWVLVGFYFWLQGFVLFWVDWS
jgi:hypothetical protein